MSTPLIALNSTGAVAPVRADVHRLPDVLDLVDAPADQERPQVLVDGRLHHERALGEGRAAPAVQARLIGDHLHDDEADAVGRGEDDLDVLDANRRQPAGRRRHHRRLRQHVTCGRPCRRRQHRTRRKPPQHVTSRHTASSSAIPGDRPRRSQHKGPNAAPGRQGAKSEHIGQPGCPARQLCHEPGGRDINPVFTCVDTARRVLSSDSPTRPRRQERLSRVWRLRGGRGGPVLGHPLALAALSTQMNTRHKYARRRRSSSTRGTFIRQRK